MVELTWTTTQPRDLCVMWPSEGAAIYLPDPMRAVSGRPRCTVSLALASSAGSIRKHIFATCLNGSPITPAIGSTSCFLGTFGCPRRRRQRFAKRPEGHRYTLGKPHHDERTAERSLAAHRRDVGSGRRAQQYRQHAANRGCGDCRLRPGAHRKPRAAKRRSYPRAPATAKNNEQKGASRGHGDQ